MVIVKCSVPSCTFETEDVSEALAIALLANHGLAHQTATAAIVEPTQAPSLRGPKLERPKVDVGVSIEELNVFVRRWEVFRTGSGIDNASAPSQLFQCAGPDLEKKKKNNNRKDVGRFSDHNTRHAKKTKTFYYPYSSST